MAVRQKRTDIVLSAEQRRRRRVRSIVLALVLAGFALLFYAVTIVKLGPQVLHRPI